MREIGNIDKLPNPYKPYFSLHKYTKRKIEEKSKNKRFSSRFILQYSFSISISILHNSPFFVGFYRFV